MVTWAQYIMVISNHLMYHVPGLNITCEFLHIHRALIYIPQTQGLHHCTRDLRDQNCINQMQIAKSHMENSDYPSPIRCWMNPHGLPPLIGLALVSQLLPPVPPPVPDCKLLTKKGVMRLGRSFVGTDTPEKIH